jgi:hypothetical protein
MQGGLNVDDGNTCLLRISIESCSVMRQSHNAHDKTLTLGGMQKSRLTTLERDGEFLMICFSMVNSIA